MAPLFHTAFESHWLALLSPNREITTCDPKHEDGHRWEKYGTKKIKEFNDNPKSLTISFLSSYRISR